MRSRTGGPKGDAPKTRRAFSLDSAFKAFSKDRRDIPLPSARVTRHRVTAPALIEAKVRL